MDQLLNTLGDSLVGSNLGDGDTLGLEGGGDDAELPREMDEVMKVVDMIEKQDKVDIQVLESQIASCVGEVSKPEFNAEEKVGKCKEKQSYLETRYRRLQNKLNKLRAQTLCNHAVEQLQAVVANCDRRRARLNGEVENKTEKDTPNNLLVKHSESESSHAVDEMETDGKLKKNRFVKFNKSRTDIVLGQLQSQHRHVQEFVDPDATESSSGGESADELDTFNASAEVYAPIQDRFVLIFVIM